MCFKDKGWSIVREAINKICKMGIFLISRKLWGIFAIFPKIYLCGFEDMEKRGLSCEIADPNKLFPTL